MSARWTAAVLREYGRGSVTAALAPVVTLHEKWADTPTEDLDPLTMWEELGRVLGVLS